MPEENTTTNIDTLSPSENQGGDTAINITDTSLEEPSINLLEDEGGEVEATNEVQGEVEAGPVEMVTVNGQEYEVSALQEAILAQQNKEEWSRINTQRAQELSDQRKAFEAERQQYQELFAKQNSQDAVATMTDEERASAEWLENNGYVRKEDIERYLDERINPITQATEQLKQEKYFQEAESEIDALIKAGKMSAEERPELYKFAQEMDVLHLPFEDVLLIKNKEKIEKAAEQAMAQQNLIDDERENTASRIISTRGANQSPKNKLYDPTRDRNMSLGDILKRNYL